MNLWNANDFARIRKARIDRNDRYLEYLKHREEQLAGEIDGLDIEYGLARIAERCKCRRHESLFKGLSTFIDHNFDPGQMKILFRLINDIEEALPWHDPMHGQVPP